MAEQSFSFGRMTQNLHFWGQIVVVPECSGRSVAVSQCLNGMWTNAQGTGMGGDMAL